MKGRVAVLRAYGGEFELREYPVPEVEPGAILVKLTRAGVCGSDLHIWRGEMKETYGASPQDLTFGHEMCGRVERLGAGVTADSMGQPLREGDRVTYCYFFPCGRCPVCLHDEMGSCPRKVRANRVAGTPPYFNNAYGDYYYLRPGHFVFRIPAEISDDVATPSNCALSQVLYGLRRAGLRAGHSVVVQGAGGLGINAVAVARDMGADKIIVIDRLPDRLELARAFGADHALSAVDLPTADRRVEAVKELTGGFGADVVADLVGYPEVIPEGLRMLRGGGCYLEVGSIAPGNVFSYDATALVRGNVRLVATSNYSPWALEQSLAFLRRNLKRFPFERIVSHVFPLERISDAFQQADWLQRQAGPQRLSPRRDLDVKTSIRGLFLALCLAAAALPAQAADPPPSGQVTWAVHFTLAPRWLDPAENEGSITPYLTLYAVHDALLKPMPSGVATPCLAESWSLSADGLVYEFLLRSGVRFHNGELMTADDVKFSFERYRGANSQILKEKIKEVRILDARRIQFRLKEPWPDFITFYGTTATSAGWIVPRKYVQAVGEDGFKKAPVGAGPYRVVSVSPGVEMTLEAFEGYWRKVPRVKRLVFRSLPDETTRAAALKRGDVDIAYFLNGPIAEDVRRTPGLKLMAVRSNTIFSLDFRDQWDAASPWRDARVRLAASLAIDRAALNAAEQLGFAGLTGNVVPRAMEFALPIDPDPYDPVRAKRLLAEAGFTTGLDGGDFTIAPPYEGAGEAIANYLAAVGIRLRIRTMERAAFFSAWREGKLKGVVFAGLGPSGNAATRLQIMAVKGGAFAAGYLPEVQDLFERQAREPDRRKREELLHQIQRILHDRTIFAPIWENGFIRGVGPRVMEPALALIPFHPYSAPYEDVRLKP